VTFKIVQKLTFRNQNNVKYFLHLIVAGVAVGEEFSNVVHQPLYLVDVFGFLPLHHQGHTDDLGNCHDVEVKSSTQVRQCQDWRLSDERLELIELLLCLFRLVERAGLFQ
jgi:hypothetical protein